MGSLNELNENLKLALGKPDVVNFIGLYNLLRGVIEQLAILFNVESQLELPPRRSTPSVEEQAARKRRKSSVSSVKPKERKTSRKESRASQGQQPEAKSAKEERKLEGQEAAADHHEARKKVEKGRKGKADGKEGKDEDKDDKEGKESQSEEGKESPSKEDKEGKAAQKRRQTKPLASSAKKTASPTKAKAPSAKKSPARRPSTDEGQEESDDEAAEEDFTWHRSSMQEELTLFLERIQKLEADMEKVKEKQSLFLGDDDENSVWSAKSQSQSQSMDEYGSSSLDDRDDDALLTGERAKDKTRAKALKRAMMKGKVDDLKTIIKAECSSLESQLDALWTAVRECQRQLIPLPNDKVIYKTFFPTWKMLEEAICAPFTLGEAIDDAINEFGDPDVGPTDGLLFAENPNKVQMVWKFLGAPGPSRRLLAVLKGLGEIAYAESVPKGSVMERGVVPSEATVGPGQTSMEMGSRSGSDTGFLNIRLAKISEDVVRLRKEMDEFQLWKDKIEAAENRIRELQDHGDQFRQEFEKKVEEDLDKFTSVQMDINELHEELAGSSSKNKMATKRMEMANMRSNLQDDPRSTFSGGVIDREARIRTQQLTMQMNMLHAMVMELEGVVPGFKFATSLTPGLPDNVQHPWGTGRSGAGGSLKPQAAGTSAGGAKREGDGAEGIMVVGKSPGPQSGKSAGVKASFSARSVSPDAMSGSRPTPLGMGTDEVSKESKKDITKSTSACVIQLRPLEDRSAIDERNRQQQQITKLSLDIRRANTKLDEVNEIHHKDVRKITELIKRLHSDCMDRVDEIVEQLKADLAPGKPTTPMSGQGRATQGSLQLRAEVFSHMANVVARLEAMEELFKDADGSILKRPLVHCFQCLSCDKPVKIVHTTQQAQTSPPLQLPPDLPRLPPISNSPPRLRHAPRPPNGVPFKPMDVYEIPRQCGGSYTATDKPRRFQFYTNLSEVLDTTAHMSLERIDVLGTDGHVYKGQMMHRSANFSNNNPVRTTKSMTQATISEMHCEHLAIQWPKESF